MCKPQSKTIKDTKTMTICLLEELSIPEYMTQWEWLGWNPGQKVQRNDDKYVQRNEQMPEWIPRENKHLNETRKLPQNMKMEFSNETDCDMTQQVQTLAARPDGLLWSRNPHDGRRELAPASCPLISPCIWWHKHVYTHVTVHKQMSFKIKK